MPFDVQDKTGFHYYHFHRQDPHSTALLALLFRLDIRDPNIE